MSPETVERYNPYEGNQKSEKYLDVERGDIDRQYLQNNQVQNQLSQQKTGQQSGVQFDPVVFVKSMISTGFTPKKSQILMASSNINGNSNSANTWFAFFIQRLLRQARLRKNKKN